MRFPRYSERQNVLALASIAAVTVGAFVVAASFGGYRINTTPSEPLGLWRVVGMDRPVAVADLVFICPPSNSVMLAARVRGYLRSGLCDGGVAPMIKTVVATAGQTIEVGHDVLIDGLPVASSALAKVDGKGRALTPYAGGVVPHGFVFLHSNFVASYDSRYFGPLPASGILGLAEEVLTYAP